MIDMTNTHSKNIQARKIVWYDDEEDILNIQLGSNKNDYWKSIELPNGIIIDISRKGKITGIEILRAKKIFTGEAFKVIEFSREVSQK